MKRLFSLTRALVARKRKIFALFFALAASIGLSWAAGIPCTAADLGKVLCTDGSIYTTVSDATAANKTAVAMIAYIDAGNNKGLALALVEEKGNANWSEAISKCAAKTPTVTGGTWKLASEDEWSKIIDAAGSRNALRDGFSAIGGSNLKSDGNDQYWSSTESSNTEKGRRISFNDTFGGWSDGTKTTNFQSYARACLAFNIGEPDPTSGSCGDNLTWEFNTETGALTISGTGAMNDYSWDPNAAPWYAHKDAITSVSFPEGITTIGAYAFVNCDNAAFTTVTIPEGVTALGVNAFYNCDGIQEITIPSTVTTIEVGAIYDCKAVNSITSYIASPTNLHGFAIYGYKNTCTLYVPYASIDAYKAADCWKNIPNIAAIPGTLTPESVAALIDAIGEVAYTAECKAKIDAARAAYDDLSTEDKALVDAAKLTALTTAEANFTTAKTEAVNAVKTAIDALPALPLTDATKKLSEYNKVKAARAAYDALLNADDKALVTNLTKLEAAEEAYAAISGGTPAGALSGKFSIDESSVVYFSKGNLQATTTDLGANWTWSFAANQWNTIGNAAANTAISGNGTVSENGTVDLFGWSTTATYYGIHNSTSEYDYEGDFVDWGATMGAGWRTLTCDEWNHLLFNRTMQSSQSSPIRYARSTVNGIHGLIIVPDDWDEAYYTLTDGFGFDNNIISAADWTDKLEAHGAVFLPVTSFRSGTNWNSDDGGHYSTPTPYTKYSGFIENMNFNGSGVASSGVMGVYEGLSVRLVTAGAASPLADAQAAKDLIDAIGEVSYPDSKEAIKAAREALDALGDEAKALFAEADTAALPAAEATYAGLLAEKVAPVIAAIDAVPATPLTDATKKLSEYNKVTDARALYDALSDEEKAAVTNYDKLTAAEAAFAPYAGSGDAGALKGKFSVADGKVVYFSKGNLQYTKSTGKFEFMTNQYDMVEKTNNQNVGDNYASQGVVSLYGWAASGIDRTGVTAYQPYSTYHDDAYYGTTSTKSASETLGDYDWGKNMGDGWRTLTADEWGYLIGPGNGDTNPSEYRDHYQSLRGLCKITVSGTDYPGMIILPDDLYDNLPTEGEIATKWAACAVAAGSFTYNTTFTEAEWTALQDAGAVFLPAAGYRNGTAVLYPGYGGYYWSSSASLSTNAFYLYFGPSKLKQYNSSQRCNGNSVRLVTENAPASPLADAQAVKDLIDAIGEVSYPDSKDAIKAAREALDALSDEAKALFATADTAALPAAEATYAGLLAEKVAPVIAAIDAVPATPLTDATKKLSEYNKVTDARALYDALTDEEKAAVTNYDKLTAAEEAFAAIGGGTGLNVSTEDIGKVLCADGSLYATKDEATAASKTPVAMIAYVEDSKGLAIALEDESDRMIWSTAITTAAAHTPAVTGGTWKLPSLLEWQQMFVGCGADLTPSETSGNVTDYFGLRDKLLAAGGNGFVEWSYWTTTEWANNPAEYAWDPYFSSELVKWYKDKKDRDDFYIRAILAFNVVASNALADAQAAKDLIDAIGEVSYPDSKEAIKAAREALDALSDEAKALFNEADTAALPQAEAAYAALLAEKVAPVIAAIDAVPATPLTPENTKLSEYNKVTDARALYDALATDEEKAAVTNYDKLTAAEAAFAAIDKGAGTVYDSGSVALTDLKVGDILKGGVTLTGEASDQIGLQRLALDGEKKDGQFTLPFENMTPLLGENAAISLGSWLFTPIAEDGNAGDAWIVIDGSALPEATVWLKGINSAALPSVLAAAQAAVDLINAIPDPVVLSDECKAKIDAAREAVTALGENASLIDDADIDKLEKAEADFAELIKDATAVVAKIDAIGDVTFSAECKEKIVDAREAYEALSEELKPYVTNLDKLTAAEAAYEAARPFAPVTTVPAAVEALQYTGAAQTLITAGAAEHGTILYSLDGVDYSTELPTALLPGAYTIYYKVQATDDYKDVAPATFIATIAYNYPATYGLFGIPEGWSVKVNDEEVAVVNGAVKNIAANDRFDIMPVKPEDVKLVEIVPYLLDLATATDSVIYLMNGDSITGTANGNISIVIVPDAKVYFKDVNLTNTGSHPAVLCGGNAEMVVVGENTITCTTEGEYGIRTAGAGTTLTISGDKTLLKATIDLNGGTVNQ